MPGAFGCRAPAAPGLADTALAAPGSADVRASSNAAKANGAAAGAVEPQGGWGLCVADSIVCLHGQGARRDALSGQ